MVSTSDASNDGQTVPAMIGGDSSPSLKHVKFNLFDFQQDEVTRLFPQKSRLIAWEMGRSRYRKDVCGNRSRRGEQRALDRGHDQRFRLWQG